MHATNPFMEANAHLLERLRCMNQITNHEVNYASIRESAQKKWAALGFEKQQRFLADAEALIEAAVEVGNSEPELLPPATEKETEGPSLPFRVPPPMLTLLEKIRDALLRALVARIEVDPYQPMYRLKLHGPPVKGWGKRLEAYFWPRPHFDYKVTSERLSPLLGAASRLSAKVDRNLNWTHEGQKEAVEFSLAVFRWGGVPQPLPPAEDVRQVFETALSGVDRFGAPMNSGWTKVAAFATAHLENQACRHPLAVWDSRVATSIRARLDELFVEAGLRAPDKIFPDIGTVRGREGTRPRQLSLHWPSGYRSWPCQFAGSRLIETIRDILNESSYPSMPLPDGGAARWTVRGLEMVFFGDGY